MEQFCKVDDREAGGYVAHRIKGSINLPAWIIAHAAETGHKIPMFLYEEESGDERRLIELVGATRKRDVQCCHAGYYDPTECWRLAGGVNWTLVQ